MVIIKKNYYLYIENIMHLNIDLLKSNKKINIILRSIKNNKIDEIIPEHYEIVVNKDTIAFIYKTLSGVRAKINDPLGKKRGSTIGK